LTAGLSHPKFLFPRKALQVQTKLNVRRLIYIAALINLGGNILHGVNAQIVSFGWATIAVVSPYSMVCTDDSLTA
jgi:hypothetical protein